MKSYWASSLSYLKTGAAALCTMGALTFGFNEEAGAQDTMPLDMMPEPIAVSMPKLTCIRPGVSLSGMQAKAAAHRQDNTADSKITLVSKDLDGNKASGDEQTQPEALKSRLYSIYEAVGESRTGRILRDKAVADNVRICFSPTLNDTANKGSVLLGGYMADLNIIELNPSSSLSHTQAVLTLLHEFAHLAQYNGVNQFTSANILDRERVSIALIEEAFSRLAEIMFAYEMEQQGNSDYAFEFLWSSNWSLRNAFHEHVGPAVANHKTTSQDPEHMKKGIRAVFEEFRQTWLYDSYILNAMKWMKVADREFDSSRPRVELMDDEYFQNLVSSGDYPDFLDDELIEYFKTDYFPRIDYLIRKTLMDGYIERMPVLPVESVPHVPSAFKESYDLSP